MTRNQSVNYLRASLHRAISQGDKSLMVSALDLKDTLSELERLQTHQDMTRPDAPLVGWADPRAIQQMRQGQRWSLTLTRKKVAAHTQQVCASALQPATNVQTAKLTCNEQPSVVGECAHRFLSLADDPRRCADCDALETIAVGGEPVIVGYAGRNAVNGVMNNGTEVSVKTKPERFYDVELIDRAHVIPLLAEIERLKGLKPDLPPRPPEGSGLPRYGIRWNGPQQPLAFPMDDGYWTPWHLADLLKDRIAALENGHSEDERFEQYVQAAIDSAPEALRRLGEFLSRVLHEDQWQTAESMLLGIATSSDNVPAAVVVTRSAT